MEQLQHFTINSNMSDEEFISECKKAIYIINKANITKNTKRIWSELATKVLLKLDELDNNKLSRTKRNMKKITVKHFSTFGEYCDQ